MFSLSAKEKKCFAVTSYSKGEGKSTVSANLAISFSKMEKRVLLIDCDLRRPNVHNIFKLDNKKGLTNVIGKMIEIDEAVKHDVLPNLDILPAGTVAPNPSELMCSTRFQELYEQFVRDYDYVIFDTPPIGVVADALLLKDMIAGFVVVVRERSTTHGDLQHLLDSVKLADSTVLGLIEVGCTYDSKRRNDCCRSVLFCENKNARLQKTSCISWANRVKYIRNLNCICNNILRSYSKWVILN